MKKDITTIGKTFYQNELQYTILDSVYTDEDKTHYLLIRNNVKFQCFVIALDFDHVSHTWAHGKYYNELDNAHNEFLTYKAIYS